MAEISGGELLVRCFLKEGCKRIFGITDAGYHTMMGAAAANGIRWVGPRHESAAVHMAEGVFKTTGEVPVVASGAGPGTANVIPGIICAREEGVPVIAITAQRRVEVIYPARSGVYQGLDQFDIFKPITKWNAAVHSWDRIPEVVETAYREALAGRPGPVAIDVPDTIMYETGDEDSVKILEPSQYRAPNPEPSEREIEEIAKLLAGAENPVVMGGTGVLNSGGTGALLELVELLNCPALTSMAARSVFPNDHPNFLFGLKMGGLTARKEADVVLVAGSRLGELDLPFDKYWGPPESQKVIQIDTDPGNIGVNRPIYLGVVADAAATLEGLAARLKEMGVKPASGEAVKKYAAIDEQEWKALTAPIEEWCGERMHPAKSVQVARSVFPPDAINVGDGGNTSLYNAFFTPFTVPRTSLGIFEFGHLGTGIPYAIGAKLANPDREVYVITGDGAAGFNFMELETALREDAKITVIVHAEESWCMEEIAQMVVLGGPENTIACAQSPVRWDKIAEAIGCHGEYVEKLDDLEGALLRARESALPAVVCVKTDRQCNLIPPAADRFMEVYEGPMAEVTEEAAEAAG